MEVINMAKDGTYRGGRRIKAGSKPDALADKIMKGAPAKRMELPDFTNDMTDFDVDDIGDGVELEGMDMPSPDDYLSALQKDGKPLGADEIYKETWLWLKERGCERLVNKRGLFPIYSVLGSGQQIRYARKAPDYRRCNCKSFYTAFDEFSEAGQPALV